MLRRVIQKLQHMRSAKRVIAVAVSAVLLMGGGLAALFAFAQGSAHTMSLGYSGLQELMQKDRDEFDFAAYTFRETAPVTVTMEGDEIRKQEEGQETVHTFHLHQDLIPMIDHLSFPLDSAAMKRQTLEALEGKVLVRFFDTGEDGTGCDSCQAVVVLDPDSRQLSIIGLNNHDSDHSFQLVVADEDGRTMRFQAEGLISQAARLEEELTDEELEALLARDDLLVEVLETTEQRPVIEEEPDPEPSAPDIDEPESPENPDPGADDMEDPENPDPGVDDTKDPENPDPGVNDTEDPENPDPGVEDPEDPENPDPGVDDMEDPEYPDPGVDDPEDLENPAPGVDDPEEPELPDPGVDDPEEPEFPDPEDQQENPQDDGDAHDPDGYADDTYAEDNDPSDRDREPSIEPMVYRSMSLSPAVSSLTEKPGPQETIFPLSAGAGYFAADDCEGFSFFDALEAETVTDQNTPSIFKQDKGAKATADTRSIFDFLDDGTPRKSSDISLGYSGGGMQPGDSGADEREVTTTHKAIVIETSEEPLEQPEDAGDEPEPVAFSAPGDGLAIIKLAAAVTPNLTVQEIDANTVRVKSLYDLVCVLENRHGCSYMNPASGTLNIQIVVDGLDQDTSGRRYLKCADISTYDYSRADLERMAVWVRYRSGPDEPYNNKNRFHFALGRNVKISAVDGNGNDYTDKLYIYSEKNMMAFLIGAKVEGGTNPPPPYTLEFENIVIDGGGDINKISEPAGMGIFVYTIAMQPSVGVTIRGAEIQNCNGDYAKYQSNFEQTFGERVEIKDDKNIFGLLGVFDNVAEKNRYAKFSPTEADGGSALYMLSVTGTKSDDGINMYGRNRIENCIFRNNYSQQRGGAVLAVGAMSYTPPEGGNWDLRVVHTFENCVFTGNQAGNNGGALVIASNKAIDAGIPYANRRYYQNEIIDCVFTDNKSFGSGLGGAVMANGGQYLLLQSTGIADSQKTYFLRNQAQGTGGAMALGSKASSTGVDANVMEISVTIQGAVEVGPRSGERTKDIDGTKVHPDANHAARGGGIVLNNARITVVSGDKLLVRGNYADGRTGGGICTFDNTWNFLEGPGTIELRDNACVYYNNMAASGRGGGIHVNGGDNPELQLLKYLQLVVADNQAQFGGGISVGAGVKLHVYEADVTVENNRASARGTVNSADPTGSGGGIHLREDATLQVENDCTLTVRGNTAEQHGGGVYMSGATCSTDGDGNVKVLGNTADKNGGGVYLNKATWNIDGKATVQDNEATEDGGGIFAHDRCTIDGQGNGSPELSITHNTADYGGGICVNDYIKNTNNTFGNSSSLMLFGRLDVEIKNNQAGYGGGIAIGKCGWLQGTNESNTRVYLTIEENTATQDGGGVWIGDGKDHPQGGGIAWRSQSGTEAEIAIYRNQAGYRGGGIYMGGDSNKVELYNNGGGIGAFLDIAENMAPKGGGIYVNARPGTEENTMTIANQAQIRIRDHQYADDNNTPIQDGAGIYVDNNATLRMDNQVTRADLRNIAITNNKAAGNGGGAYIASTGQLLFKQSTAGSITNGAFLVEDNEATYGGGFYLAYNENNTNNPRLLLIGNGTNTRARIIGNKARIDGGGIYVVLDEVGGQPNYSVTAYQTAAQAQRFQALRVQYVLFGTSGSTGKNNEAADYVVWDPTNETHNPFLQWMSNNIWDIDQDFPTGTGERTGVSDNPVDGQPKARTAFNRRDINFEKDNPFRFVKRDGETNEVLEGAEFTLYRCGQGAGHNHTIEPGQPGSCWTVSGTPQTSNGTGLIDFGQLTAGTYLLVETKAPDAYVKSGVRWLINSTMNGALASYTVTAYADGTTPALEGGLYAFDNERAGYLEFYKSYETADGLVTLEGGGFALYELTCDSQDISHNHTDPSGGNPCFTQLGTTQAASADQSAHGLVRFDSLEPDVEYYLVETAAPVKDKDGNAVIIQAPDTVWKVTGVSGANALRSQEAEADIREDNGKYFLVNRLGQPLVMRKVYGKADDQGNYSTHINGATFQLYRNESGSGNPGVPGESGSAWVAVGSTVTSAGTGLLDFGTVTIGHYALVELETPDDYQLPMGYWSFELDDQGKIGNVKAAWQTQAFLTQPRDSDGVEYLIPNYDRMHLPRTGTGLYVFFAMGVMCILSGFILFRGARREEY